MTGWRQGGSTMASLRTWHDGAKRSQNPGVDDAAYADGYVNDVSENDSLPIEYELRYRYPHGQARLSDFINNAPLLRIDGRNEGGFQE